MGIHYDKLWKTLKEKGMSSYTLINYFELSPHLVAKLRKNETVNTTTIDKLCGILQCNVEDILTYEEDELNVLFRNEGLQKIEEKQQKKKRQP